MLIMVMMALISGMIYFYYANKISTSISFKLRVCWSIGVGGIFGVLVSLLICILLTSFAPTVWVQTESGFLHPSNGIYVSVSTNELCYTVRNTNSNEITHMSVNPLKEDVCIFEDTSKSLKAAFVIFKKKMSGLYAWMYSLDGFPKDAKRIDLHIAVGTARFQNNNLNSEEN